MADIEPVASTSTSTSLFTSSASPSHSPRSLISSSSSILLRLPSGILKPIKLPSQGKSSTINLGRYGSFKSTELEGKVYGQTYEILKDGKLLPVAVQLSGDSEDTAEVVANNQHITSTGAQNLTFEDIKELKDSGLTGREIIAKQIEEHSAYELKTEYSKEKYLKKKEAKYIPLFTVLPPTIHDQTTYNFNRIPSKTNELRADTMANLLALSNVRPGSRLLVVEDLGGLIVSACAERMGGTGTIMVINDADSPPDLHLIESFNFPPESSALDPIQSIHWAATESSWVPPDLPLESTATPVAPVVLEELEGVSEEEKEREMKRVRNLRNKQQRELNKLKKRKGTFDKSRMAREEFFKGEYDGLIIATSSYEPYSIIERLTPYLAGSSTVLIYSPILSPLQPCLLSLRSNPSFIHTTIHEPFLRQYQVLPGRTHPEMQGMQHGGGFLLSGIRVRDEGGTNSVRSGGKRNGKRREENGEEREGKRRREDHVEAREGDMEVEGEGEEP